MRKAAGPLRKAALSLRKAAMSLRRAAEPLRKAALSWRKLIPARDTLAGLPICNPGRAPAFGVAMSRGFVKEDDALPPPVVPPRAPLPSGSPNYVTPRGLALLRAELTELEAERGRLDGAGAADAQARTQALLVLNGRISALTARLASAKVVEPRPEADEVRFGATVTLAAAGQPAWRFTIVGVDEADAASGRLAFVAPLARAVLGKRVGDQVPLPGAQTGPQTGATPGAQPGARATITAISYDTHQ